MLALFRAFLSTWAARAFFIVLVGAFALWGVADVIRNLGRDDALAIVGDRKIQLPEFQDAFRRQLAQVSRMLGGRTEPTPAIRKAVAEQVLDRMVIQAAIAEEVSRLGITVPDEALRQTVFEIPAFRGRSGAFERTAFEGVLRANNLTEGRFLELERADIGQRQLIESVQAGVTTPEQLLKQVYAFQRETRVAELVELPFTAAPPPPPPSENDLKRLYENNPAAYSAPALRRIKAVILSPETVARDIAVSDDDVKAYYDQHKAEYVTPEKRSAQILVTQDEAVATRLADAWRAGADWPAMQKAASDAGAADAALDDATRAEFPTTELAGAVFTASADAVTGPVKTPFGYQILRVTKVTPGDARTLEAVADEVRGKVARERATDLVYTRATKLEDALSAGTSLDELPGDLGVAAVTGTLDAQGNTQQGEPAPIPGSPALRQAIVTAAFAQAKGEPARMTEGPDQSYYALSVEDASAPALKPFAEVEPRLRDDYDRDRRRHAQEQAAARLLTAAKGGGSLDDAATIAGLRTSKTPPISRSAPPDGTAREIVEPLFGLKQGETTMVETQDGFLVLRLAEVAVPDPAADPAGTAQMRDAITQSLQRDVEVVFATALRERTNARVNRAMLDSQSQ
ncbi:MAG: SurA N-terminal domain-containing protein [Acetobacteraceae bacterium]